MSTCNQKFFLPPRCRGIKPTQTSSEKQAHSDLLRDVLQGKAGQGKVRSRERGTGGDVLRGPTILPALQPWHAELVCRLCSILFVCVCVMRVCILFVCVCVMEAENRCTNWQRRTAVKHDVYTQQAAIRCQASPCLFDSITTSTAHRLSRL